MLKFAGIGRNMVKYALIGWNNDNKNNNDNDNDNDDDHDDDEDDYDDDIDVGDDDYDDVDDDNDDVLIGWPYDYFCCLLYLKDLEVMALDVIALIL